MSSQAYSLSRRSRAHAIQNSGLNQLIARATSADELNQPVAARPDAPTRGRGRAECDPSDQPGASAGSRMTGAIAPHVTSSAGCVRDADANRPRESQLAPQQLRLGLPAIARVGGACAPSHDSQNAPNSRIARLMRRADRPQPSARVVANRLRRRWCRRRRRLGHFEAKCPSRPTAPERMLRLTS